MNSRSSERAALRQVRDVQDVQDVATAGAAHSGQQAAKSDYLLNRRWRVASLPFKHCVVNDVFVDAVYRRISSAFEERLSRADGRATSYSSYDAKIWSFEEQDRSRLFPLLDHEFLSTAARALELEVTFEIDGAMHHHPPGSRTGWIYNDFNPGWFPRAAAGDEVMLGDHSLCNYRTGKPVRPDISPIQRMRRLTLIYYVNNKGWRDGDGGETGLYASQEQQVTAPDLKVPPIDNNLMMFECSPHSFHSFLSTRRVRNSVILWLHCDLEHSKRRWPHHEPVYWQS